MVTLTLDLSPSKGERVRLRRPLPCHLCYRYLRGEIPHLKERYLLLQQKDSQNVRLSHEVILLPDGPGARALILIKTPGSSNNGGPVSPAQTGVPCPSLNNRWDIIKELATLALITHDSTIDNFNAALDSSLERVLGVSGAETVELFLYHAPSKEMLLIAHRGLFKSAFSQIRRFKIGEGYPGLIAAYGEPILTQELIQDNRYLRTQVKEKGVRFYLCVPLKTAKGVVGSLNIASRRQDLDAQSLLQFLTWSARPLSSAVQLAWFHSQEKVADYKFDGTWEPDKGAVLELEQAMAHTLTTMIEAGQAQGGRVVLSSVNNNGEYRQVEGPSYKLGYCTLSSSKTGLRNNSQPLQCPALASGSPVELVMNHHLTGVTCRGILKESSSAICLPLRGGDKNIGAITLAYSDKDELLTRRMALLGVMADRASRVVSPLYQRLKISEALADISTKSTIGLTSKSRREASNLPLEKKAYFLDIQCLGGFRVYLNGILLTPKHFRRRQAITVLKILITQRGHRVSSEFLTECLWPESDPDSARKRLWVAMHDLRKALEPVEGREPIIMTDGDAYYFNTEAHHRLDVDEFLKGMKEAQNLESSGSLEKALHTYKKAAQLYRGLFLEEEPYSDWCSAEREYLREVHLSLLKRIAQLYERKRDYEQAILYYRLALSQDSLREELHRQLISCLWHAGRRDEALSQYEKCSKTLSTELGVEPLEETQALYRAILGK